MKVLIIFCLPGAPAFAADLSWNPAQTNGVSVGSGAWDLATSNWWNGTTVSTWNNGASATFWSGGDSDTVTVSAPVTVDNLAFTAGTNNASVTAPFGNKPIPAYLASGSWQPLFYLTNSAIADFFFSNITHLVYIGSLYVETNAALVALDSSDVYSNVVSVTHAHGRKAVVTLLDQNGTTTNSTLSLICPSPILRATLVTNVLNFCQTYGFDGIDIDWEPAPTGATEVAFVNLLQELRAAAPPGFTISVAWMSGDSTIAQAPVDWFFIMGYTWNWSQLMQYELNSWIAAGAPLSKVLVGMGTYGQTASGQTATYARLVAWGLKDASLDSFDGYNFTGINTVKQITQNIYNGGYGGIGWFLVSYDTFDPYSLMLAGATQARSSATALGLGSGYRLQGGSLDLSGAVTVAAGALATIDSPLGGTNGLTKNGSGTLVLGGTNTYAGGTLVSQGALVASSSGALGSGDIVMNDARTGTNNTAHYLAAANSTPMQLTVANQGAGVAVVTFTGSAGTAGYAPMAGMTLDRATQFVFSQTARFCVHGPAGRQF